MITRQEIYYIIKVYNNNIIQVGTINKGDRNCIIFIRFNKETKTLLVNKKQHIDNIVILVITF